MAETLRLCAYGFRRLAILAWRGADALEDRPAFAAAAVAGFVAGWLAWHMLAALLAGGEEAGS